MKESFFVACALTTLLFIFAGILTFAIQQLLFLGWVTEDIIVFGFSGLFAFIIVTTIIYNVLEFNKLYKV
jgi:hypothetical protein